MKKKPLFLVCVLLIQVIMFFIPFESILIKAETLASALQSYPAPIFASSMSNYEKIVLDITTGSIDINLNGSSITSINGMQTNYDIQQTIIEISGSAATSNTITIKGSCNTPVNILLVNVNISAKASGNSCAFLIRDSAKATLYISGSNSLTSVNSSGGLEVREGCELTIASLDGEDENSLTARAAGAGAGIGGVSDGTNGYMSGSITINSGKIFSSSNIGAGIGGGGGSKSGSGGNVIINGGEITAYSSGFGAGIGGGQNGPGGSIIINGGCVKAYSGMDYGYGAGIGGGSGKDGGTVKITGGIINAYSSINGTGNGAGIGGGDFGGGNVIIEGGTVTAFSSDKGLSKGAGIGCGSGGSTGNVVILGGSVNAKGSDINEPIKPLPTNGNAGVFLSVLDTGSQNAGLSVSSGSIDDVPCTQTPVPEAYGINGVKADNNGQFYFWLPQADNELKTVSLTLNNIKYSASYNRTSQTLYSVILDDILSGRASISVQGELGFGCTLTVSCDSLNVRTNLRYIWYADGQEIGNSNELYISSQLAGNEISAAVFSDDVAGSILCDRTLIIPYMITLGDISGAEPDEELLLSTSYENENSTLLIGYKLADLAAVNSIEFSIPSISLIDQAGAGTIEYIVNGNDSENGVITISAIFTHITDLSHESLVLTPPVKNNTPETTISGSIGLYDVNVKWSGDPDIFAANTVYTAEIALSAQGFARFATDFSLKINGKEAELSSRDDSTRTITFAYTFPLTEPSSITGINIDASELTFIDGDMFIMSETIAELIYEDGRAENITLGSLAGAVFFLTDSGELYDNSIISYSSNMKQITVLYNGIIYTIPQHIIVYALPILQTETVNVTSNAAGINISVSKGSNDFDFKLNLILNGAWNTTISEIFNCTDDLHVIETLDNLTPGTDYECQIIVTDCVTGRNYASSIIFRTLDSIQEPDEEPDINEPDIDEPNTNEPDIDEPNTDIPNYENSNTDNGIGLDITKDYSQPPEDNINNNMNIASPGYSSNNPGNTNGRRESYAENAPPESILIGDTKIPLSRSDNRITILITDMLMRGIMALADNNELFLDFSSINNTRRMAVEIIFEDIPQLKKLIIKYPSGVIMELPHSLLEYLSKSSSPFIIVLEPGGLDFSFALDNIPFDWNDYSNSINISIPIDSGGLFSVIIDESSGKVIPRSWYNNNRIYVKFGSTGSYRVANRKPAGFHDVDDYLLSNALSFLAARSIIYGVGENNFEPMLDIKYSELVAMLSRSLNTGLEFADSYYSDRNVSRGEMYIALYRAMLNANMIESSEDVVLFDHTFVTGEISDAARQALTALIQAGIIDVSAEFPIDPNANISRGESAWLIYQMLIFDMKAFNDFF